MEESPKIRASVAIRRAHSLSHIHGLHAREYERRRRQYNTAQRARDVSRRTNVRRSLRSSAGQLASERAGGQPTNRTTAPGQAASPPPPARRVAAEHGPGSASLADDVSITRSALRSVNGISVIKELHGSSATYCRRDAHDR